jgi:hypothetical protein
MHVCLFYVHLKSTDNNLVMKLGDYVSSLYVMHVCLFSRYNLYDNGNMFFNELDILLARMIYLLLGFKYL